MKISGIYQLPASPDSVFVALTDPAVLQQCIPGCERMARTEGDTYAVEMKVGVAMIKGAYKGRVTLKDLKSPQSYTMIMEGCGKPGFVRGTAHMHLRPLDHARTEVRYDADAQVGGLIAAVGSRLVEAAAKKTMDDFMKRLAQKLAGSG
jgi:carbon monoxide dehydrogenase subunit G